MESIAVAIRKLFPPLEEPFRSLYFALPDKDQRYLAHVVMRGKRARDARTAWFAQKLAESGEQRRRSPGFFLITVILTAWALVSWAFGDLATPMMIVYLTLFAGVHVLSHFARRGARRAIALNAPLASPPDGEFLDSRRCRDSDELRRRTMPAMKTKKRSRKKGTTREEGRQAESSAATQEARSAAVEEAEEPEGREVEDPARSGGLLVCASGVGVAGTSPAVAWGRDLCRRIPCAAHSARRLTSR